MKSRFFWRITLPYIFLFALILCLLGVYISNSLSVQYQDNLKEKMLGEARLIAQQVAPLLTNPGDLISIDSLTKIDADLIDARVTIILETGVVVGDSDYDPVQMDNHLDRPEVQKAISGSEASEIRFSSTLFRNFLYTAVPVNQDEKIIGVARLSVDLTSIEQSIQRIQRSIALLSLLAFTIALSISILISFIILKPLREITQYAHNLAPSTLEETPTKRDEISQLKHAITSMAERITGQFHKLEAESNQLSAVLTTMSDGIIITSSTGAIRLINPAAIALFEVTGDHTNNTSFPEIVRNFQINEIWKNSLTGNNIQSTTVELLPEKTFLQAVAIPLTGEQPGDTLMIFQDLTRLRKLEVIRRDFISNVSHELRTPLSSLKALTETLHDGALNDPPAAKRFLNQMNQEIDNLIQLVEELLELAKIESGRVPLKIICVSPRDLILPSLERMKLQADRSKIDISFNCPDNLPFVKADPQRIEQVLINLLHNAIKFTPPGGKIQVEVVQKDDQLLFSIKDTGVGVAPEDIQRIFERFYKADKARSSRGTGLGLSIARHLVESHGGTLWAESELGKGSTFFFSLPIDK
jgi:two-component system phosphate regulon sensor histidine kinase PhoR